MGGVWGERRQRKWKWVGDRVEEHEDLGKKPPAVAQLNRKNRRIMILTLATNVSTAVPSTP